MGQLGRGSPITTSPCDRGQQAWVCRQTYRGDLAACASVSSPAPQTPSQGHEKAGMC